MNSNLSTVTDHETDALDLAFNQAKRLCKSGNFIPAKFRNNPEELAAAILTGRELGIPPMASVRSLHVIEGRVGMEYPVIVGMLQREGYSVKWGVNNREMAEVEIKSRKDDSYIKVTYTIKDAEDAKLLHKDNWKKHRATMLRARAISNAARAGAGGIFSGVYCTDEIEEIADNIKHTTVCEAQSGSDAFDQILLEKTHNNEEDAMSIDVYGGFLAKINSSKSEDELKIAGAEISHCEKLTDTEKNNLREKWKSHKELLNQNYGGNEIYEH